MPVESTDTNTTWVRSTDSLPIDLFQRHLTLRHVPCGDFANLLTLEGFPDQDRHVYEAYHKHLHERYAYDHEHR